MSLFDALDDATLVELTNPGTVRRARKELGSIDLVWTAEGAGWRVTCSDGTEQHLGIGHFDTWSCSCPAEHRCRHIVRAVLSRVEVAPVPPESEAAPEPASDRAPAAPRVPLLAQVSRTPRLLVRLMHPVQLNVRHPVGRDLQYARCECGAPQCEHLAWAAAAEAALPPDAPGGLVRLGELPPGPSELVVGAAHRAWRDWLEQLLDVGLGTVDHLLGHAVRLASDWELRQLWNPAAAVRDLAEQLEHHRMHDSQLSPERLLLLIGEVEARLGSLARADAPAPPQVVAGSTGSSTRRERSRLVGLGAEFTHVGGWNQLRVHLLDVRTGAVASILSSAEDTEHTQVLPSALLSRRTQAVPLRDWASGTALVPVLTRTGGRLSIGRGRVSVAPGTRLDLEAVAAVAPRTLAEVEAALPDLPRVLAPRESTDAVMLVPIARTEDVMFSAATGRVSARLVDVEGRDAELSLAWGSRTRPGAEALHAVLADPDCGVLAVAGRWYRTAAGLRLSPTAVWTERGVLLPQSDVPQSELPLSDLPQADRHPTTTASTEVSGQDPWHRSWDQVVELLGQLVVLGGRRGATRLSRETALLAVALQGRGLGQTSALLDELAEAIHEPERRARAVAALCLRLAFVD